MTAARSLITENQCSAACLLAAPANQRRCRCRCKRALHGMLAGADVSTLLEGRHLHQLSDLEVLMTA